MIHNINLRIIALDLYKTEYRLSTLPRDLRKREPAYQIRDIEARWEHQHKHGHRGFSILHPPSSDEDIRYELKSLDRDLRDREEKNRKEHEEYRRVAGLPPAYR